jgi:hypothetical protein
VCGTLSGHPHNRRDLLVHRLHFSLHCHSRRTTHAGRVGQLCWQQRIDLLADVSCALRADRSIDVQGADVHFSAVSQLHCWSSVHLSRGRWSTAVPRSGHGHEAIPRVFSGRVSRRTGDGARSQRRQWK